MVNESKDLLQRFTRIRATVVGDVMLDRYWYGNVERISPESPVPVVDVQSMEERLGGAANVAANLAALRSGSTLISIVGDDSAGRAISALLAGQGIQDQIEIDAGTRTTEKLRIVSRNQQLLRVDFETKPDHEVLARTRLKLVELLPTTDVLVLSDYGKGGLAHIGELITEARNAGIPIVVDPKGSDYERYIGASVLTPNLKEFELAGGDVSSEQAITESAAAMVRRLQLEALLVTRSSDGMTLFTADGGRIHSPAKAREVFDVSGAGDTVVAVMAVGQALGLKPEYLLELCNRAAGYVVSKFGTAIVDPEKILHPAEGEEMK